ncbi:hypothetical protein LTR51_006402 [Lithohypha guttulata]|nr:hypothetical protein LTR51_006402 [Lithohypha guttulata]
MRHENNIPPAYRIQRKPVAGQYRALAVEEPVFRSGVSISTSSKSRECKPSKVTFFGTWWLEILACVLVLVAFAAILITLLLVADKPLPRLPFRISVNTLIAVFATTLKVATAFVLAEGLSQMKWSWYSDAKPLHHFLVYDNASRGPWGALQLLWHLRLKAVIASLGAFITVAALFIDPLSQQLVHLYDCSELVKGATAMMPRARAFEEIGGHVGAGINQLSPAFVGSLATGQFAAARPEVPFSCTTGNCTFDQDYSSVGYCSQCNDVTDRVVYSNYTRGSEALLSVQITLPNKDGVTGSDLSFLAGDCGSQAVRFRLKYQQGLLSMLWFDGVGTGPEDDVHVHACECSLEPCIQTFRSEVVNGILREEVLDRQMSFGGARSGSGYMGQATVDLKCINDDARQDLRDLGYQFDDASRWLPYNVTVEPALSESDSGKYGTFYNMSSYGITKTKAGEAKGLYDVTSPSNWTLSTKGLRVVPSECIYELHLLVGTSLQSMYFSDYFNGNVTDTFYCSATYGSIVPQSIYQAGAMDKDKNGSFSQVEELLQNITDSMTTYMRWHGNSNMSEPILGEVHRYAVCVRVRWNYLAYSGSICVLLMLFFVAMVFETRRACIVDQRLGPTLVRHNFKSSALAFLLHGLDRDMQSELRSVSVLNNTREIETASKEQMVVLSGTDSGLKLSASTVRLMS